MRAAAGKLAGGVLGLIPPERLRERADGGGIAPVYVLWHLARHQDVAVNGVLRGVDAVVDGWADRLCVGEDLWRGLAEGEDADLVDVLDPEAVGGIRARGVRRHGGVARARLDFQRWTARPETAGPLEAIGTPADRFDWLYAMWDGKPASWFLQWSAVGHGINHLGELVSIRNRMGLSPF